MRKKTDHQKPLLPLDHWSTPSAFPAPPDSATLHVWRIDLDREHVRDCLSADEQARAARLHPCARQRFIAGRSAMREILAAYRRADPAELRFRYNRNGKPLLDDLPLGFNLAHSGTLGLLAVGASRRIGVDIELIRPLLHLERIARRLFDRETQARLMALEGEARLAAFLQEWTRLEAGVKAIGGGVFQSRSTGTDARDADDTSRLSFRIGQHAIGAMAVVGGDTHFPNAVPLIWPCA